MGTQVTTNYGWVYPNPFEEDDAWGPILNALFVDVDADLKAVADGKGGLSTANTWTMSQTFSAINTFGSGATGVDVVLNGAAGTGRQITYRTNGLNRWVVLARSGPETGANAGSNFAITSYDDAGNYIEDPLVVTRATGAISIKSLFLTNDLAVTEGGTGASDAAGARTNLGLGALATLSTVGAAEIIDGAVGTAELANGGVTTAKVADGAITAAKLAAGVIPEAFPSGTRILFQQTNAPTGWTKDTTQNDKALRVVSGAVGSGGSTAFSTVFASRTVSGSTSSDVAGGTVAGHALTIAQIPSHTHTVALWGGSGGGGTSGGGLSNNVTSGAEGGGQAHSHGFTGAAHAHTFSGTLNMAVSYVDIIIAQKD